MVSFGQTYYLQFHLWQNNRQDLLEKALLRIRHKVSKSTNTAAALRFMRKYMFTHRYGSRKYATHVAVVITDGKSQNRKATLKAAEAARNNGIEIFGFGVGDAVDFRELENIASKPTSDYVYEVKDFQSLGAMKFVLANRACKGKLCFIFSCVHVFRFSCVILFGLVLNALSSKQQISTCQVHCIMELKLQ